MKTYKVIISSLLSHLEEQVEREIKAGGEVLPGFAVVSHPTTDNKTGKVIGPPNLFFYQPMLVDEQDRLTDKIRNKK